YLTVLMARAREEIVAGATVDRALDTALRRTAAASTGSGLLMIAALIPFATTELLTVREFGVGVAVAVALDAFLVRPVLLPAAVEVLGRWSWWPTRLADHGAIVRASTEGKAAGRPDGHAQAGA